MYIRQSSPLSVNDDHFIIKTNIAPPVASCAFEIDVMFIEVIGWLSL
jgi:hypothetical protein